MRNLAGLAVVSILVFSIVMSGCGKLGKKDFDMWKDDYVAENAQKHEEMGNKVSELGGKVDAQGEALRSEISTAKEDAIAASQQGDADTITAAKQFSQDEDARVREDLTQTANMVGDKAQQAAKSGDDELRMMIGDLEKQTKMQAESLSSVQMNLTSAQEEVTKTLAKTKPMIAATVHFAGGRAGLSKAAKEELDKAVTAIQGHSDVTIVVKGHSDGSPVLNGRYRSNWDLSQARADAIAKYLKDKGVANTIETRALAHTEPIAPVNTAAGRKMNRRAEVVVYPAGTMM